MKQTHLNLYSTWSGVSSIVVHVYISIDLASHLKPAVSLGVLSMQPANTRVVNKEWCML